MENIHVKLLYDGSLPLHLLQTYQKKNKKGIKRVRCDFFKYLYHDWPSIDCIFATWLLPKHEHVKSLKIATPLEESEFAKDKLHHCFVEG